MFASAIETVTGYAVTSRRNRSTSFGGRKAAAETIDLDLLRLADADCRQPRRRPAARQAHPDPTRTMICASGIVAPDGSSTRTKIRRSWAAELGNTEQKKTPSTTTRRISCSYEQSPVLIYSGWSRLSEGTIESMSSLGELLQPRTREGDVYDRLAQRLGPMPCLWARLPHPARRGRCVQGSLQRGRRAASPVGICRWRAVRSD